MIRDMMLSPERLALVIVICAALALVPMVFKGCSRMALLNNAVRKNDRPTVEALLTAHPELMNAKQDKEGLTPLHWAVICDRANIVEWLLAHGAEVNAADRYKMTPLHKAAGFNRKVIAELLMAKGADIRAMGLKYGAIRLTPLHLAAEAGYADLVEVMLAHGADLNVRTEGANPLTPLHLAAGKGRADVVELLLKKGAEVSPQDANGNTPLRWATVAGDEEAANVLRIYGGTE